MSVESGAVRLAGEVVRRMGSLQVPGDRPEAPLWRAHAILLRTSSSHLRGPCSYRVYFSHSPHSFGSRPEGGRLRKRNGAAVFCAFAKVFTGAAAPTLDAAGTSGRRHGGVWSLAFAKVFHSGAV